MYAGLELWERYRCASASRTVTLEAGGVHRERVEDLVGNGLIMADITTDQPLEITTGMGGPESDLQTAAVTARLTTESRGVFVQPDVDVEATVTLDGTLRVLVWNGPWAVGTDATDGAARSEELKGDYGGITWFRLNAVRPADSPYRRLMVLLVPRGGTAGAIIAGRGRLAQAGGGLVVFNDVVDGTRTIEFDFSLPANSSAPVHFLLVPLKR